MRSVGSVAENEKPPFPDQGRTEILADEGLVAMIGPGVEENRSRQSPPPAMSGNQSRSSAVGVVAMRSNVLHHVEPETHRG
jgi:hypothetical protein